MHITHVEEGVMYHTIRIRNYWEGEGIINQNLPAGATVRRERDNMGSGDYMLVIRWTEQR